MVVFIADLTATHPEARFDRVKENTIKTRTPENAMQRGKTDHGLV